MKLDKMTADAVQRCYSLRQNAAHERVRRMEERLYREVPGLRETERELARCYAKIARMRMEGKDTEEAETEVEDLLNRQNEMLIRAGVSPDFRDEQYQCNACRDTGMLPNRQHCKCFYEVLRNVVYRESDFEEHLKEKTFDHFRFDYYDDVRVIPGIDATARENVRKIYEDLRRFVTEYPRRERFNILLMGHTGVGKTHLALCLANALLDHGIGVHYISAVSLRDLLVRSTMEKEDFERKMELREYEVLIIDDLGVERMTDSYLPQLLDLINERVMHRRPTICTTNLDFQGLGTRYTERMFSRIVENFEMYRVYGEDIRVLKSRN